MFRLGKWLAGGAAIAVLGLAPLSATAGTVYNNENTNPQDGDCSFNTTCAGSVGRGDEFAAQAFSLSAATTITSGSWIEIDQDPPGSTSVNYAFYLDGGAGTPTGAALFSGSAATTSTDLGGGSLGDIEDVSFSLGSINLGPGNYFFAIQDVSSEFANFLGQGLVESGAAESNDGGLTWAPGYEIQSGGDNLGGIGVALFSGGAVPEPSAWALMLVGFGGLGAMMRRRRMVAATA
jgi:hypothetical protein